MKTLVMLALTVALVSPRAQAQTCLGHPMNSSNVALGAHSHFTDGARSYIGEAAGYGASHFAWSAGFGLTNYDEQSGNEKDVEVSLGYVVKPANSANVQLCPFAEGSYGWWNGNESGVTLKSRGTLGAAGMGLGVELPMKGGSTAVALFAQPAYMLLHFSTSIGAGGLVERFSADEHAFQTTLGGGFKFRRAYIIGHALLSSLEGSSTLYGISVGFTVK